MQRGNGSPACASCKHQRKKCTDKCILAQVFPVEKTREFLAVHKVFGVSNVAKMLKNLNHEDRKKAAESMIWEACCWQRDPIHGPYGDYRRVFEELKMYTSQYLKTNQQVLPTKGNMVYKAAAAIPVAPVLIGWNNNNNKAAININGGGCNGGGGSGLTASSAIDSCSYRQLWRENDDNQQYFAGQCNSTDAKTVGSFFVRS